MDGGVFLLVLQLLAGTAGLVVGEKLHTSSEFPAEEYFSLEAGTGIKPLHMALMDLGKRDLAEQGLIIHLDDASYPVLTLSEVWRVSRSTELCLTEGASAIFYGLRQFERFGYDPKGRPRFDLSQSTYAGRRMSKPAFSLTGQARFFWFPSRDITLYSAVGIGFSTVTGFVPLPEIVPVALRYGRNHLYVFLENNIGPFATFVHGGLGWKF